MSTVSKLKRPWAYMCPVQNLVLGKDIAEELAVLDVVFVSSSKARRIRKRLGLPVRVSSLPKFIQDGINAVPTLAVMRTRNEAPDKLEPRLRKAVEEACFLIMAGSWPYVVRSKETYLSTFGPPESHSKIMGKSMFICRQKARAAKSVECTASTRWKQGLIPFRLDGNWKQNQGFFFNLMAVLSPSGKATPDWRQNVRRSAILAGRSLQTLDKGLAFLLDFMALDSLLLCRSESSDPVLFERLELLLGWTRPFNQRPLFTSQDLSTLCKLRHALVHDGDSSGIKAKYLLLSDLLVFNLLSNISRLRDELTSKQHLLEFEKCVEARRTLKMSPYKGEKRITQRLQVVRPRTNPRKIAELDSYMG